MSFDGKLKRLGHRNWREISDAWAPYIAQLSFDAPGQRPDAPLDQIAPLEETASRVPPDGELREEVLGLRPALLHEGLFLLHKAANVFVASQLQVTGGLPTWSIASAYQSAFFSMEALLRLLGVVVVEIKNKTLVIDVWPEVEKNASKKQKALYRLGTDTQHVWHKALGHYERWAILKRVLRTLNESPIDFALIQALNELDDREFARQRNRLHYSNTWMFDDLHAFASSVSFCKWAPAHSLVSKLDPDGDDFTVVLAALVFSAASSLLAQLADTSPLIADERTLLDQACQPNRMTLRRSFESAMGVHLI